MFARLRFQINSVIRNEGQCSASPSELWCHLVFEMQGYSD